jgi:glycosyltransferase involved in cell wall biosynthesis
LANKKRLLFIHDALPSQGISGQIVFLRHFERLKDWDIEIVVPDQVVSNSTTPFSSNWKIHTLPSRQTFWPPFREENPILLKSRIWLWQKYLEKNILAKNKPDAILTVLWHYYAVTAANLAKKWDIPLFVIIHDCWDLRSTSSSQTQIRKQYATKVLANAKKVWSVTRQLGEYFTGKNFSNLEVLPPIPAGYNGTKVGWKSSFTEAAVIIYAGTVEAYHYRAFAAIATAMKESNDTLIIITNPGNETVNQLTNTFNNIKFIPSFPENQQAIEFIINHASAVLVSYGFAIAENPFAEYSFPSKFVEFCHTGLPILAVAPPESAFCSWLEENDWSLLIQAEDIDAIKSMLQLLKQQKQWEEMTSQTSAVSQTYFNPERIHQIFESGLNSVIYRDNPTPNPPPR